jgi:DHA2 family multidrug resistance protein-like MFS transporter
MSADLCVELRDRTSSRPPQTGDPVPDTGLPIPQRYWAVAGVWLALIVSVLDNSIANIALPSIARDLGARPVDAIAIVGAFQLGAVISLLPMAALGEILEYRRVFLSGLAVFTLASLICALAHDLPTLVAGRVIQGIGAAGIMSVNGALARFIYPYRLLGAALGSNALIIAAFSAMGPTIASAILQWASWQWLFAINLPIGAVALAMGLRTLPHSPKSPRQLDIVGTVLNVAALALLSVGVDLLTASSNTARAASLVGAGCVAAFALVHRSVRQVQPLVPLDLLKIPVVRLSALTSMTTFAAQTLSLVSLPFHFQDGLHLTTVQTGLLMTPWPVGVAVAAPVAGWLADRLPVAILGGCGLLVMFLALASMWLLPDPANHLMIGVCLGATGVGFGFFQAPNNRTLMSSTPLHRSGAAAGLIALSRVTGQMCGTLLLAGVFRVLGQSGTAPLGISAILAAIAAALSFARRT